MVVNRILVSGSSASDGEQASEGFRTSEETRVQRASDSCITTVTVDRQRIARPWWKGTELQGRTGRPRCFGMHLLRRHHDPVSC